MFVPWRLLLGASQGHPWRATEGDDESWDCHGLAGLALLDNELPPCGFHQLRAQSACCKMKTPDPMDWLLYATIARTAPKSRCDGPVSNQPQMATRRRAIRCSGDLAGGLAVSKLVKQSPATRDDRGQSPHAWPLHLGRRTRLQQRASAGPLDFFRHDYYVVGNLVNGMRVCRMGV